MSDFPRDSRVKTSFARECSTSVEFRDFTRGKVAVYCEFVHPERRGWKRRRDRSRVCFKDLRANVSTRSLYTRHESTVLPALRDKTQGISNGLPLRLPATLRRQGSITDPAEMRIETRNDLVPGRFAKIVGEVVFS